MTKVVRRVDEAGEDGEKGEPDGDEEGCRGGEVSCACVIWASEIVAKVINEGRRGDDMAELYTWVSLWFVSQQMWTASSGLQRQTLPRR